ncbi:SRPBCC domain-containing protein [Clavibacter lycopersici]|uniref:SRPBCC domain-containing protein n=1 Tax=Clavibacter lycopersici TaxID=2301718 RepID=A0A399T603_9MICO|nr:SRPBCC domain-containing protein [Clavibacter lycopersici]RIJ50305.1 SRPBCC domain-containing protein [Clavibacter lycopersici]RIJ55501.1 SRPBCC domain-containing protein [Clavibacter lycopersici]
MSEPIVITRTFAAPRERVFDAWTTPADFSAWFGTAAVDVPLDTLRMDVREGGSWSAVMRLPDGDAIRWAGEYVELDRPTRVAMTMTDRPEEPAGDPLTVDLEEVAGGATRMTMTQTAGEFTPEQRAMTMQGWDAFLDVMEGLVAPTA